jgi:hypothetical protein
MPWWLFLYLAIVGLVVVAAVRDDLREQTAMPYIAADVVSIGLVVLVALGYWVPSIASILGNAAQIVYCTGAAWLVVGSVREIRGIHPRPTLGLAASSVLFYTLLYTPLLYWGFMSTFGGVRNIA